MHKNLAKYIEVLRREGELLEITAEVSPELEISEIVDRVSKSPGGGKALLLKNTGTQFPLLINMMGSDRRMALALGLNSLEELPGEVAGLLGELKRPRKTLSDKLSILPLLGRASKWFPRHKRGKGECQQVVFRGDEVDLSKLPILKTWFYDGGRFVTLPLVHTQDPETGVRNVGMYRMQELDNKTTGMHWQIHKTGAMHYEKYKRLGKKMPVTVCLGGDPAYTFAATAPLPEGIDEYILAGFLRKKPVKLVKCLTNELEVPVDCDFVIEGYVDPAEEKIVEGPFGDHTGFYSLTDRYPKFHVTAITHRRGAIYPATIVGVPPQEDAYIAMATERIFLSPIRFVMQPEVRDMTMPTAGTAHNIAILSIEKRYSGEAHKVIQSMWGAGQMMFNKYLVIARYDCDIRDNRAMAELLRSVDLKRSVVRSEGVMDVLDHATATMGFGGKLAIDLTEVQDVVAVDRAVEYSEIDGVGMDSSLVGEWSTLILFAPVDMKIEDLTVESVGINFVAIFDSAAEGMSHYDLLWIAAANSDPRRDVYISKSGVMSIDARSKRPNIEGNPSRFPNVVTSHPETIELVDRRWAEYSIGEFIESPSRHYRSLLLSDREDW